MTSQAGSQIVTTVAQNIRHARVSAGMTQRTVAAELGLDIRAVSRWERAGISPSMTNLAKLSDLFGHEIAWFYTEHEIERSAAA